MRVLAPLHHRDFLLLWLGKSVSLVGDGVFVVAIAFQAYAISNSPGALSAVGLAWTLPTVLALPLTGVLSDRVGRRPMMIGADVLRPALSARSRRSASGGSSCGTCRAGRGVRAGGRAVRALVHLDRARDRPAGDDRASQLDRPDDAAAGLQFLGPALGGLVAAWSIAGAFALDAASFAFSALMLALLHTRRVPRTEPSRRRWSPTCGRASPTSAAMSGCGARWSPSASRCSPSGGRTTYCCPT